MKKKVVVHIIPRFCFGGAERLLVLYAQMYDTAVYDMHVVSCVEDGELRASFDGLPVSLFVGSRLQHGGRWGAWRAVRRYLDRVQPDIVHTHLLSSDLIGFVYKYIYRRRVQWVSTQHNVEDTRPWVYRFLWRMILPAADAVIAVAPRVYEFARDTFGVSDKRLHVVNNGILVQKWKPLLSQPVCRQKVLQIASIGRLEIQKGHVYALRALAQLSKDISWHYHVYGDGMLREELQQLAHELYIDDRITWHGVVNTLEQDLGSVDIVFQPSLFEGLSLVILESMAAGRCVVTTPAGGEGVITHGVDGYIVPSMDVEMMSAQLTTLALDRQQIIRTAAAAGVLAQREFDVSKNMHGIETVYQQLLS